MKTQYQYIRFDEYHVENRKTRTFACRNNKSMDRLGTIEWSGHWRQYIFAPHANCYCQFSAGCLADIQHFIGQLMEERRNAP